MVQKRCPLRFIILVTQINSSVDCFQHQVLAPLGLDLWLALQARPTFAKEGKCLVNCVNKLCPTEMQLAGCCNQISRLNWSRERVWKKKTLTRFKFQEVGGAIDKDPFSLHYYIKRFNCDITSISLLQEQFLVVKYINRYMQYRYCRTTAVTTEIL